MRHLTRTLGTVGVLTTLLAGCGEIRSSETRTVDELSYWHESDDFTDVKSSYLDAKVWIDRESGEFIDLQFQCFRKSDSETVSEFNLIVGSSISDWQQHGSPRYLSVVLYKRDDQDVQIYRDEWDKKVLSNFQRASLDVYSIFSEDENGDPPSVVRFRFVYGASPIEAELGQIATLSRAPSVDFSITSTDTEAKRFLNDCAPSPLAS